MRTYQLHILTRAQIEIEVGRLGVCRFPPGRYVYTGSAKTNMDARIARHKSNDKKLRWHIDYLLNSPHANITRVTKSSQSECAVNQSVAGDIPVPGFGASDCKRGCISHLKRVSKGC
jgi:Uri superfamily endonuclease